MSCTLHATSRTLVTACGRPAHGPQSPHHYVTGKWVNNMLLAIARCSNATMSNLARTTWPHARCTVATPRTLVVVAKKGANKGTKPSKADLPSKICETCGRPFTWCVASTWHTPRPHASIVQAEKMGKGVGGGQVLLRPLPQPESSSQKLTILSTHVLIALLHPPDYDVFCVEHVTTYVNTNTHNVDYLHERYSLCNRSSMRRNKHSVRKQCVANAQETKMMA